MLTTLDLEYPIQAQLLVPSYLAQGSTHPVVYIGRLPIGVIALSYRISDNDRRITKVEMKHHSLDKMSYHPFQIRR
jgi:hypothetical protein